MVPAFPDDLLVYLGLIWAQIEADLEVDRGSIWGRFGVGLGSVWFRFVLDLGLFWGVKENLKSRMIANGYHEGKTKRTSKRESYVPELAEGEANGTSVDWNWQYWCRFRASVAVGFD